MEVTVDVRDRVPIFAQLVAQIRAAVSAGRLAPGEALPPIRQLANDLALNHNTVAKAYRALERDAVIETLGRRGTFVHPDARANALVDLNALATSVLSSSVSELRDAGLTDSEIRNTFVAVMKSRQIAKPEEG